MNRFTRAGLVAVAALGLGVVPALFWSRAPWQDPEPQSAAAPALPALPDLGPWPGAFQERVVAAQAAAAAGGAPGAVAELGRLYHANGFIAEAAACWRRLVTAQPREPRWRYYLCDLSRAESDHAGLASGLTEVLGLAPDYAPAYLQRASLQLKSGEFEAAERDYQSALRLAPADPYARLGLARVALHRQRPGDARARLEELLRDTPHFSTAHNLYAELLAAAGDRERADWHRWLGVETLRYREPPDPWLDELQAWCHDYDRLCVLGSTEVLRDQHEGARALYERALALRPAAPEAYHLLADMYLRQNQAARARDLLEGARSRVEAGRRAPLFPPLCQAYRDLGDNVRAERVAREGIQETGASAELLEALGLARAGQNRHRAALDAYAAALRLNPNDASLNYNRAVTLLAVERLDDALAALDRSLTLQPGFVPTLLLRGEIEMAAGHWADAERCFRRVLAAHPQNELARRLLATWERQRPR